MRRVLSDYSESQWLAFVKEDGVRESVESGIAQFKDAMIRGRERGNKSNFLFEKCACGCGWYVLVDEKNIDTLDFESKCMLIWEGAWWCEQCRPYRFGRQVKRNLRKKDVLSDLVEVYGLNCAYCGKSWQADCNDVTIDHRVPIGREKDLPVGIQMDDLENLAICCRACNSRKKRMTVSEYKEFASYRIGDA